MSRKDLSRMRGQRVPAQPFDPSRSQNPAKVRDDACYLYDLEIGDAGAGYRRLKRNLIFSRLFDNVAGSTLNPFTKKYAVVQDPPLGESYDNCRLKIFHVEFWGQSLIQMGNTGDDFFLPDRSTNGPDGAFTQVPTPLKGYLRADDGMYQIFDILGSRNIEIYATHVDAGFLAPESSCDASALPPDGSKDTAFDGIVDQSYVGVSISQVVVNGTQIPDDMTRCVAVDNANPVVFPVPSGARSVCISPGAFGAALGVSFTWNPSTLSFKGLSDVDVSLELATGEQTRRLCIPDTPFMRVTTDSGNPIQVCFTFSKEL